MRHALTTPEAGPLAAASATVEGNLAAQEREAVTVAGAVEAGGVRVAGHAQVREAGWKGAAEAGWAREAGRARHRKLPLIGGRH